MRIIFNLLVVFASLLSLLILAIVIFAIINGGEFNVLLPGLGLIITFWGIIIPLLVIDASIIVIAFLIRQFSLNKLN